MKHVILLPAWALVAFTFSHSAAAQSSYWTATETTLRGSRLSDLADTSYLLPWDLEALKMDELHAARQWWTDDEGREVTAIQVLRSSREAWMGAPPAASERLGSPPLLPQVPPRNAVPNQPLELGSGWTLTWSSTAPQQVYAKGDSSIALTWAPTGNQWSVRAEERSFPRTTQNGLCVHDWSYTTRSPLVGYGASGAESLPKLEVRPNPRGRQTLEVSLEGAAGTWPTGLRCVDAYGRPTGPQPPQGALPIEWDPQGLTPGKYTIQIQLGSKTYTTSFIQH